MFILINNLFQGGQVWLKDKDATHCKLCEKEFSISRRKVWTKMQCCNTQQLAVSSHTSTLIQLVYINKLPGTKTILVLCTWKHFQMKI